MGILRRLREWREDKDGTLIGPNIEADSLKAESADVGDDINISSDFAYENLEEGTTEKIATGQDKFSAQLYAKKIQRTTVSTSAVEILGGLGQPTGVTGLCYGQDENSPGDQFVDYIIGVRGGSITVVSSESRGTPASRSYNIDGDGINLSMGSSTYDTMTLCQVVTAL